MAMKKRILIWAGILPFLLSPSYGMETGGDDPQGLGVSSSSLSRQSSTESSSEAGSTSSSPSPSRQSSIDPSEASATSGGPTKFSKEEIEKEEKEIQSQMTKLQSWKRNLETEIIQLFNTVKTFSRVKINGVKPNDAQVQAENKINGLRSQIKEIDARLEALGEMQNQQAALKELLGVDAETENTSRQPGGRRSSTIGGQLETLEWDYGGWQTPQPEGGRSSPLGGQLTFPSFPPSLTPSEAEASEEGYKKLPLETDPSYYHLTPSLEETESLTPSLGQQQSSPPSAPRPQRKESEQQALDFYRSQREQQRGASPSPAGEGSPPPSYEEVMGNPSLYQKPGGTTGASAPSAASPSSAPQSQESITEEQIENIRKKIAEEIAEKRAYEEWSRGALADWIKKQERRTGPSSAGEGTSQR